MPGPGVKQFGSILLVAATLGCAGRGQPATGATANRLHSDGTNWFAFSIRRDLPPFHFHIVRATELPAIRAIEVFKDDTEHPFQLLTNASLEPEWEGGKGLAMEDMNFDGFQDLTALSWWGATGNIGYNCWLYETNTGRFAFSAALSELCSPRFEAAEKRIYTHAKGGSMIFSDATYVWENGGLVMIEEVAQDQVRRPIRDWLRRTGPGRLKPLLEYQPEYICVTRVRTNQTWKITTKPVRETEH
jgi:hypothetical protein